MPKFLGEKLVLFLLFCYFHLLFGDFFYQNSFSRVFILQSISLQSIGKVPDFVPGTLVMHLRRTKKKATRCVSGCLLFLYIL